MSEYLSRFVNWWSASFRAAGTQGRVATLHSLMAQGAGVGCALVAAPLPTSPPKSPPLGSGPLRIVGVNKVAEYVDILNDGAADVDLGGWVLVSEKGNQRCGLGGIIGVEVVGN